MALSMVRIDADQWGQASLISLEAISSSCLPLAAGTVERCVWARVPRSLQEDVEGRTREWPAAVFRVSELLARECRERGFQPMGQIARVRPNISRRIPLSRAAGRKGVRNLFLNAAKEKAEAEKV